MKKIMRWYAVGFKTLDRNPIERTVKVKSTDSIHASMAVYANYGRKKIEVVSAVPFEDERHRPEIIEE